MFFSLIDHMLKQDFWLKSTMVYFYSKILQGYILFGKNVHICIYEPSKRIACLVTVQKYVHYT